MSSDERDPVEALAEEFAERLRRGERPALSEFVRRLPERADELRQLLSAVVMMEDLAPEPPLLSAGLPARLGDFRILRRVGRGGMGEVYEAVQESLGRHVALKVLPARLVEDPTSVERFRREARAAAGLHHSNIVPVFGVGEAEDIHFYAMQFIAGQSLSAVLDEVRRLRTSPGEAVPPTASTPATGLLTGRFECAAADTDTAAPGGGSTTLLCGGGGEYSRSVARLGLQAAEALAYAHRHGVTHRDVKPGNLLLDVQGTVWVADFGLAKAEGVTDLTATGEVPGTPRYMAPEQLAGKAGSLSDVYSLGVTLYEMLTLRPPFDGDNLAQLLDRVRQGAPVRPRLLDAGIPPDLETVVLKAMAREPRDRYASADDLAEDLRRFLNDLPIHARRVSAVEQAWRWARRNPTVARLAAAVVVLLVGGFVGSLIAVRLIDTERRHALQGWSEADRQTGVARAAEAEARAENLRSKRQLVRFHRDKAEELLEAGDMLAAMPWLARALEMEPDGPQAEEGHRRRLADTLHHAPRLLRLEDTLRAGGSPLVFFPDGRSMLTASRRGLDRLYLDDMRRKPAVSRGGSDGGKFSMITPDAAYALTTQQFSTPQTVACVWDLRTGELVQKLTIPGNVDVRLSPDGRFVAAHRQSRVLSLWSVGTGTRLLEGRLTLMNGTHPAFSQDGRLLLGFRPGWDLQVWETATGISTAKRPETVEEGHPTFAPRGGLARSVEGDRVTVWDWVGRRQRASFQHPAAVRHTAFSPDGGRLASASADGTLKLWAEGQLLESETSRHDGEVFHLGFSPDGRWVLSAGQDRTARMTDAVTGQPAMPPLRHPTTVRRAGFSPDGCAIFTEDQTHLFRLWELVPSPSPTSGYRHTGPVTFGRFCAEGRCVVSGGDGEAVIWDPNTGHPLAPSPIPPTHRLRGTVSPGGWRLLTGSDTELVLWDLDTGKRIGEPLRHESPVKQSVWAVDGESLLTLAGPTPQRQYQAQLWDAETGRSLGTGMTLQPSPDLALGPSGRLAVASGAELRLVDARSGRLLARTDWADGPTRRVRIDPTGEKVLASGVEGVLLWKPLAAPTDRVVIEPGVLVRRADFSPDGQVIATDDLNGMVKLWTAEGRRTAARPIRLTAPARLNGFSPDGRWLVIGWAVAPKKGGVQLWEVETGLPLTQPFAGGQGAAKWTRLLDFDGKRVLMEDPQGRVSVHPVPGGRHDRDALLTLAHATAGSRVEEREGVASAPADVAGFERLRAASPGEFAWRPGERADWHRAEAEACERDRQWQAAGFHLGRLLRGTAEDAPLLVRRGLAYAELRRDADSDLDFCRAAGLDGETAEMWDRRARLHEDQKRADRAALDLGRLVALRPDTATAWQRLALAHARLRQWGPALAAETAYLRLQPDDTRSRARRSHAAQQLRQWDVVIEDCGVVLQSLPTAVERRSLRALAYAETGQWEKAAADCEQLLREAPGKFWVEWYAALLRLRGGDEKGYRALCEEAVRRAESANDPSAGYAAAVACRLQPEAVRDLFRPVKLVQRAADQYPSVPDNHSVLGCLLYRAGKYDEAAKRLNRALDLRRDGGTRVERLFLAMANAKLGRADEARRWLDLASKPEAWEQAVGDREDNPGLTWAHRLEVEILGREAEAVVAEKQP